MRVATVQFASGSDKDANLRRLGDLVAQAATQDAQLVVAPEASMHTFGERDDVLAPAAEPLDGPFVSALSDLARTYAATLVAGMFETVDGDRSRAYNTVVAVGPDGALLAAYRKIHLFDALGWTESKQLEPGPVEPVTFQVGDFTAGLMTCYDVRFPELARALVDSGASLLLVPAAWVAGPQKVEQWEALVTARAVENTSYVVGAGQPPPEYAGHSLVVDPYGVRLASLGDEDGIAVADLDTSRVAEVRERMPSLQHRRFRVDPAD